MCRVSPWMRVSSHARGRRLSQRFRSAAPARSYGDCSARADRNRRPRVVSPLCALSQISGWRDRGLYPLARGCRAPRRIMPEPWTGRLPISVWRIRLAAAAELWGQRRRRRAGNTAVRGVSAVCSLSDFRLARSRSLSVGAWLPSAAPDHARALDWAAADFCLANSVGGGRIDARSPQTDYAAFLLLYDAPPFGDEFLGAAKIIFGTLLSK